MIPPPDVISPPSTLGVMGGGQLARMFAIAAKQMGYKVAILEPDQFCPAHLFADYHIMAPYDDKEGLNELAKLSQVVTTEFENVPAASLKYLQTKTSVYPDPQAIAIAQNRCEEKDFFNSCNLKTTQYIYIDQLNHISNIDKNIFPALLKTNTLGYDGKGQIKVNNQQELMQAFNDLAQVPCVLEKIVKLDIEVSIMVARNNFETICYPIATNTHLNGILETSIVPSKLSLDTTKYISDAAKIIIEKLDYIGVLGIEFFITQDGDILCNEMAPRPHNSGHYTIDACITSQFEQQVRAICNLKLGNTTLHSNAVMLNLLGDIWPQTHTHPSWQNILVKYDNLKLHLYGKIEGRKSRKMGHLVVLGNNVAKLLEQIYDIKKILGIAI